LSDARAPQTKGKAASAVSFATASGVLQRKCDCGNHTIGGKCDDCTKKKSWLQRKATNESGYSEVPGIVHEVLRSSGQPLDGRMRGFMESSLAQDFSQVRVHADAQAGVSADAVSAEAYTVRNHVVFGAGKYRPATEEGRHVIAHELVHVLQQGEGPVPSRMNLGSESSPLERQAHRVSADVMAMFGSRNPSIAERTATDDRRRLQAPPESEPAHSSHDTLPGSEVRTSLATDLARSGLHALDAPVGTIQRKRVPEHVGLQAATPISGPGFDAARAGLARLLSRAWAGLTVPKQTAVQTAMASGVFSLTWTTEADLFTKLSTATRDQLVRLGQEIRTADPTAELGSPLLIDVGARPGTSDAANITTLVNNANTIFTTLAGTTRDTDIEEVFGAGNVADAKTKYGNAKSQMDTLHASNKIVTDRSGYSKEVGLGGLSNSAQISVRPQVIDSPGDDESVVTLIHESMHAGNPGVVRDKGYISQPSFTQLDPAVKLTNAAHFEVVPRRILGASHAFIGVPFTPAGTGGTPALTPREEAIRGTSETYRSAWTAGLRLHKLFVRLFRTPTEWNTLDLGALGGPAGAHFEDVLPFWSKVEMLTIHARPAINPVGNPDVQPVTLIDIALSEEVIRRLSLGMNSVPPTPAAALALETASATTAERTAAAASVAAEQDLLIRLVIRAKLGSITGPVSRDERVVVRMAQAGVTGASDLLAIRPPSAFP